MDLSGKAALVTGGAKRVGRAIVLELARAGCDLAVHYRSSHSEAEETATAVSALGRRAVLIQGDLNDASAWPAIIERAVARLGRLDILVNNASLFDPAAAVAAESADASADSFQPLPEPQAECNPGAPGARATPQSPMTNFDSAEWDRMLRVNTVAPAALAHYARPHLSAHGSGRIINLCDISADRPWPDYLAYCASKAALLSLTKGLARAFAPTITVNAVSPGIAVFPDEYPAALREKLVARVPLAREGTPEEIARLVRFLVESGDYITGQIISIDGGRSIV